MMKKVWILVLAAVLLVIGGILEFTIGGMLSASDFALSYFAAGDFALGVFAAGKFSCGIFSIGLFSVGVFSISIFNVAVYSVGIFVIAYKKRLPKTLNPDSEKSVE